MLEEIEDPPDESQGEIMDIETKIKKMKDGAETYNFPEADKLTQSEL